MQGEQDTSELNKYKTDNLMLVPVFNSSNEMIGVLGSINMKKHWSDCTLLECVSRNFLMALTNIRSYRQIEQIGLMDMLTGLRNRNCYEHSLEYYITKNVESLCCLYIDANGLHELNNSKGHEAGDRLIRNAAAVINDIFYDKVYRIVGDEFVVIFCEIDEQEFFDRMKILRERMNREKISVSAGSIWKAEIDDLEKVLKSADSCMYEEKEEYYRVNKIYRR